MSATEETLTLLRSIDTSLKLLVAQSRVAAPAAVADDHDLDSQYGDPVLKFKPRDWTGADFKNCHFSQCPPALLDLVAETFDYFARQAEEKGETTTSGKPVAPYKRKDAARARGWAKRMRDGKISTPTGTDEGFGFAGTPDATPETTWADAPGGDDSTW